MMKKKKAYLRKKGKWASGESKFIIEKDNKFIGTVPKAEELIKILRLDGIKSKPSQNRLEIEHKVHKKFGQELLNEPSKQDINRTLWEITK